MNATKILLGILIVALLSVSVMAFDVTLSPKSLNMLTGQESKIDIIISSPMADRYTLSVIGLKPWMTLETSGKTVSGNGTIKLFVSPNPSVSAGTYMVTVIAESSGGDEERDSATIRVEKGPDLVIENVSVSGELKPLGTVQTEAFLKSYSSSAFMNITVKESIMHNSKLVKEVVRTLDVQPLEKIKMAEDFQMPAGSESGPYSFTITVMQGSKNIASSAKPFRLGETDVINKEYKSRYFLLGYEKIITIRNDGNAEAQNVSHTEALASHNKKFYAGSGTVSGNEVSWIIDSIEPGKATTLSYKIDYSYMMWWAVFLVLLGWFVLTRVRMIELKKCVMQKKHIRSGESFTITLDIKNNTGSKVADVVVKDMIPSSFIIHNAHGFKPLVKKTERGTELLWRVKSMERGEDRMVNYQIRSVFSVAGKINLPRAEVHYKQGNRVRRTKSWLASVGL